LILFPELSKHLQGKPTYPFSLILRFVLDYKDTLDWQQSLVIGSIIATTDPVAVVAL